MESSTLGEALRATLAVWRHHPKIFKEVGPATGRLDGRQSFPAAMATRTTTETERKPTRMSRRPKRSPIRWSYLTTAQVCLLSWAICVLIAQVNCNDRNNTSSSNDDDDANNVSSSSDKTEETNSDQDSAPLRHLDELMLSTKQPRQQFRIHLGSGQSAAGKRSLKMSMHNRRAAQQPVDSADQQQQQPRGQQEKKNKKISSAALKKLLSQTLPKYQQSQMGLNGSSGGSSSSLLSSTKGPNFKFVFIQRATAAPSSGSPSTKATTSTTTSSTGGTSHKPATKTASTASPSSSQSPQATHKSLAASISKQLASSLLYSAANLMSNLTAPSISTLASQQHQNQQVPSEDQSANDIKRIQTSNSSSLSSPTTTITATKSKPNQRKSRPSKVYNLPLKFVANGQPNGVMFHTIRQHFATIKKLQSMAGTSAGVKGPQSSSSSTAKRRKPNSSAIHNRLKGTNSRLIYLPLKYLSNARSTGIMSTKASHKLLKSSAKNDN